MIGGGAGGATCARYLAKDGQCALAVTLVEEQPRYTTCFYSNLYLAGWGADSGEMSNSMNSLVVTLQPDKGLGPTNRGRYSNKQVDELVVKAMATVDDAARETLLQQASKLAMSDYGIIPLHFEVTPWAFKKGLSYRPRVDQYTLATEVQQVGS